MNKKIRKAESLTAVHTYTHTGNLREKGITLIALVVTIVVLLILAGVSINLVIGDNGVIARAKEARNKTLEDQENTQEGMNYLEDEIIETLGELKQTKETAPYFPDNTFSKVGGTIDTGIVIQDTNGNQYVWVVVPRTTEVYKTIELGKTTLTDEDCIKIENDLRTYTRLYRNEMSNSDTWYADDKNEGWFTEAEFYIAKNNMLRSIYLNGGFYVGRYEAGSSIYRLKNNDKNSEGKYIVPDEVPVSKADAYPYVRVTRTQAQKLAEKVNSGNYTSSLMFGIQWDLVLAFINKDSKVPSTDILITNSTVIGNYCDSTFEINRGKYAQSGQQGKIWNNFDTELDAIIVKDKETGKIIKTSQDSHSNSITLTTGATDYSKLMNIYDIAGNVWEWILEKDSDNNDLPINFAGGDYYDSGANYSASYRGNGNVASSGGSIGFRVSIY